MDRVARTLRTLIAGALSAVPLVLSTTPATAVPPAGLCSRADPARPPVADLPWAQRRLDPARAWPYSTGAGVTVAVIDTGVDADHPQLRGRVLPGEDYYNVGVPRANFDCDSHGTAVASIIAAANTPEVGFRGVAPGARILPVRVADRGVNDGEATELDPVVIDRAIRYAVWRRAKVINLSFAGTRDYRLVRDAIAYAQSYDVLVVAAVGNDQERGKASRPTYPAGYDGVVGVGSIDQEGRRVDGSRIGPYVDLVAPGDAVLGATRRGGHNYWDGTSFATPFVAATAALVRAAWPQLSARQVAARLAATASVAPGGSDPEQYGAGVVDPYRAVTDGLTARAPAPVPAAEPQAGDPVAEQAAALRERMESAGLRTGGIATGAMLLLLVLVAAARSGIRRGWRATRPELPAADRLRDEPPDELFVVPPPPVER